MWNQYCPSYWIVFWVYCYIHIQESVTISFHQLQECVGDFSLYEAETCLISTISDLCLNHTVHCWGISFEAHFPRRWNENINEANSFLPRDCFFICPKKSIGTYQLNWREPVLLNYSTVCACCCCRCPPQCSINKCVLSGDAFDWQSICYLRWLKLKKSYIISVIANHCNMNICKNIYISCGSTLTTTNWQMTVLLKKNNMQSCA